MGWKIAALMICSFAMGSFLTDIHNNKVHADERMAIITSQWMNTSTDDLIRGAELRRKLDVAIEKLACAEMQVKEQAK